jgi:type II secretory pathway predicted ATPase ExeA
MYEAFYGLRANPFSLAPDPMFLYLGRQHRYALTLLEYTLKQGSGFALISGEIGSGKTTVIQYLLTRIERHLRIAVMTNTHPGLGTLLPWIMGSLGLALEGRAPSEQYDSFCRYLASEFGAGRRVVLIIDEAQNLTAEALEELRVLSNVNAGATLLLQTILVGQPELRATLRAPRLKQFAQRIAIDHHIEPLQREDTHAYVRHRLRVAGGPEDILSSDAIELVHARTGGVPRLINQICETALVYGFADQRPRIDAELVGQVLRDRGANGIIPLIGNELRAEVATAGV